MSSPSKRKGTEWETEVAGYLGTRRLPPAGAKDVGDLDDPDWVIECKAEQRIDLAGYMDELSAEMVNTDDKEFGVAVVKRRRGNVKDAYAVMPLWLWREVRNELRDAPPRPPIVIETQERPEHRACRRQS
jgi:hypothetical protein